MPAILPNGLFFSEFLGDNAGGSAFDTDGDGGANKADEFIEIQSSAGSIASLDGIEIWSAKRGQLFEFADGETIAPGATATVVGQYDGAEPDGFYDAGLPDDNSNQGLLEDGEGSRFDTLYLVDTKTGEFVALSYGDPPQTSALPSGFPGTIEVGSESINTNLPNGSIVFRNADGDLIEGTGPTPGLPGPICFVRGTMIRTREGETPVEALAPGALVETLDRGLQPIHWVGRRRLDKGDLARNPAFRPIRIAAGALGPEMPKRDLLVSPQHRILIASPVALRMFGQTEVLVPARKLVGAPGIAEMCECTGVEYFHVLLERHEILLANGAPAESLLLGPMAQESVGREAMAEIAALFPETLRPGFAAEAARSLCTGRRSRKLVSRHVKNRRPFLDGPRLTG